MTVNREEKQDPEADAATRNGRAANEGAIGLSSRRFASVRVCLRQS